MSDQPISPQQMYPPETDEPFATYLPPPQPKVQVRNIPDSTISDKAMEERIYTKLRQAAAGKQAQICDVMDWVLPQISIPLVSIDVKTVPSDAAVEWLKFARNPDTYVMFMKEVYPKFKKPAFDMGDRYTDDNRDLTRMIDRLIELRKKAEA